MLQSTSIANPRGWLRGPSFDLSLIFGVAGLALLSADLVVAYPPLFPLILFLDIWILGYQHVIATFTRLAFDTASFRKHRFLAVGLPWIILAGTASVCWSVGFWAIATTYLYWQWFHYTRQSYGIMRYYSRRAGDDAGDARLTTWALYLLPLWGILHRSHQAQDTFLGMEVAYLPTHASAVALVGAAAIVSLAWWSARQIAAWRQRRLPVAQTLYMLSHFVVFFVGYIVIDDIDHGWLTINVWHNAQYILIVWMHNANRFEGGVDPRHRFLSTLSQRRVLNVISYFVVCMLISTLVYAMILMIIQIDIVASIPLVGVITYQTINFHHYVVDGLIWTKRGRSASAA